ncbi:regucalcin-like isoform X2 [Branchiostoma floridae]|uniref:Regucalcin n=1 Tax=Branchiostoma floridae TaxID=7739 RepID=A0A9J7HQH8_BRAFL|nr:regucalcin-like isoform X2 [Branchiostoma floridae]
MAVSVAIDEPGMLLESPHWDDRTGTLLYVDHMGQRVHHWSPVTKHKDTYDIDCVVGAVVPRESGGAVVAAGTKFAFLDFETGKLTSVATVDQHKPTNRFNDGKCDAAGRFWAGTIGKVDEGAPTQLERKAGSLYCLHTAGIVTKAFNEVDLSNGLTWTSDNSTMYYIDSLKYSVDAFDFDMPTGTLSNRRQVMAFNPPVDGMPDGMCLDTDGKVWIAMYGAGQVLQVDPSTGTQLRSVKFPAPRTTSCCFGGPNLDVMYVTSTRAGYSPEEIQQNPLSGCLFQVTEMGARGTPGVCYKG